MKEQDYDAAMKQLEAIVAKMEQGQLGIEAMVAELKTAKALIKQCRDKLTKTEEEIKEIISEEN